MSSPVPISHGRRRASSPRKAIPGKRLVRTASSVNASTTALFDRRVLRASSSTVRSVDAVKRTLNGSPLRVLLSLAGCHGDKVIAHKTYWVREPVASGRRRAPITTGSASARRVGAGASGAAAAAEGLDHSVCFELTQHLAQVGVADSWCGVSDLGDGEFSESDERMNVVMSARLEPRPLTKPVRLSNSRYAALMMPRK